MFPAPLGYHLLGITSRWATEAQRGATLARDLDAASSGRVYRPGRSGRSALSIVITYAVVAGAWIFGSDMLSRYYTVDPDQLTAVAVLKGMLFVAVTAVLLYALIKRTFARVDDVLVRLRESEERVRRALDSTVEALSRITEVRDPYTAGHQRRVSQLAAAIAEQIGLPDRDISEIRIAGSIHDIGKISVPSEILTKPGELSAAELELVRTHAQIAYDMLSEVQMPGSVVELVYQHHERCDGSGYPRGLRGARILEGAKILAVADVVEAISSHRPYRAARGVEAALQEIERGAGTLYDTQVCGTCVALFRSGRFSFEEA